MKTENRVARTEGMFLKVQHFQQADRRADRMIRDQTEALSPYPWGITELAIDRLEAGDPEPRGRAVLLPDIAQHHWPPVAGAAGGSACAGRLRTSGRGR